MNPILMSLNNPISQLDSLKKSFGTPADAMNTLMQRNPQFKKFMEDNKGKSPEQIAADYGIDINTIRNLARFK